MFNKKIVEKIVHNEMDSDKQGFSLSLYLGKTNGCEVWKTKQGDLVVIRMGEKSSISTTKATINVIMIEAGIEVSYMTEVVSFYFGGYCISVSFEGFSSSIYDLKFIKRGK